MDKIDILKQVKEKLDAASSNRIKERQQLEQERADLVLGASESIAKSLEPYLERYAQDGRITKEEISAAMREVQFNIPEQKPITVPEIKIPAPIVNIPAPVIHIPETKFPEFPSFPSEMGLRAGSKPFPVIMHDAGGKPINWGALGSGGATGGRGDFFTIKDIQNSTGGSIIDADGNVKVAGSFSVTASNSSTHIIDASNNIVGSVANPLNVAITSGAASSTKAQIGNSDGDYSQTNPLPVVFSSSGSTASALIDSSGVQYSGSNPFPIIGTVVVSSITASTASNVVDSSGIGYSGSNPFPVTLISGTISSTRAQIGNTDGDFSQANPLPVGQGAAAGVTAGWPVIMGELGDTTGTFTNATQTTSITTGNIDGYATVLITINGTYGTATGVFELSDDAGATYYSVSAARMDTGTVETGYTSLTNTTRAWVVTVAGADAFRVRSTAVASGTVNIRMSVTSSPTNMVGSVQIGAALPTGSNSIGTVVVSSITASTQSALIDSSGIQYSGSNPLPVTWVSGAGATIGAANIDSSGVQYSGSNPFPVTLVSNTAASTIVIGDQASDAADNGSAPVKIGGIGRQTNPAAVSADGDRVTATFDDLGRQVMRINQARDLVATAYVALSTGAETTLLTAAAATYLDLTMLTATNNSTAATQLDIRAGTGGNIIHTMYLPASTGPVGFAPVMPWPQDATGNSWTIDMPDQTGTTVYVSALFSKEV